MGVAAWRGGGEQERQKEAEEQTEQEQQEEPEEQMEQQQETETATSSTNKNNNIKRTPLSNTILSPKGPRAKPCLIVPPPPTHTHTHTGRKLLNGTLPCVYRSVCLASGAVVRGSRPRPTYAT